MPHCPFPFNSPPHCQIRLPQLVLMNSMPRSKTMRRAQFRRLFRSSCHVHATCHIPRSPKFHWRDVSCPAPPAVLAQICHLLTTVVSDLLLDRRMCVVKHKYQKNEKRTHCLLFSEHKLEWKAHRNSCGGADQVTVQPSTETVSEREVWKVTDTGHLLRACYSR